MNFLHDKHSRYYCIFIVTLVLLLFLMGIAVIDTQTAATKEMFLTHNNAIATSLLEEGISKEVIATALMNTEHPWGLLLFWAFHLWLFGIDCIDYTIQYHK